MRLLLLADGYVGLEITKWILKYYPHDISLAVTTNENIILKSLKEMQIQCVSMDSLTYLEDFILSNEYKFDLGVLLWWPKIIKKALTEIPEIGFINTHPSLLPNNRGKHPNFWALVENLMFGVSIHFIDQGIDSGDIIASKEIKYNWEDTGETLYRKSLFNTIELFKEIYPDIRKFKFERRKQDLDKGSFHLGKELEVASRIDLDEKYYARDLLNLLRARTFIGYPGCWFEENGEIFEVRIDIKRKQNYGL